MKTAIGIALGVVIGVCAAGAASAGPRIGVTMTSFDNPWLTLVLNGMKAGANEVGDVELQFEDAHLDVSAQLNQVQNFIASQVDAIIVNPVDGDSTPAITKLVTEAGIPLVYVNHPPSDLNDLKGKSTFVGSNEKESGTLETEAICKLLGGKGKAVVIMGPLENEATRERTDDVHEVLSRPECKGIKVVEEQTANWVRSQAQDLMSNWLTAGIEFNAVIANNDEMAIGAVQAMKVAGLDMKEIVVGGIDATPDGLAAMAAGDIDVTVFQDAGRQGAGAVKAAVDMASGKDVPNQIWIPFELVTPENMANYQKK